MHIHMYMYRCTLCLQASLRSMLAQMRQAAPSSESCGCVGVLRLVGRGGGPRLPKMYLYLYITISICVYVYVCRYIYIYTYIYIYIYMYVYVCM